MQKVLICNFYIYRKKSIAYKSLSGTNIVSVLYFALRRYLKNWIDSPIWRNRIKNVCELRMFSYLEKINLFRSSFICDDIIKQRGNGANGFFNFFGAIFDFQTRFRVFIRTLEFREIREIPYLNIFLRKRILLYRILCLILWWASIFIIVWVFTKCFLSL